MTVAAALKVGGMANPVTSAVVVNKLLSTVTLSAGSLLAVGMGAEAGGAQTAAFLSASASGLTLAAVPGAEGWFNSSGRGNFSWWVAPVISAGTYAVTGSSGTMSCFGILFQMFEITGQAASPLGAAGAKADLTTTGPYNVTLSATPALTSLVLGGIYVDTNPGTANVTPGAGWTNYGTQSSVAPNFGGIQGQSRSGVASTSVDWAAVNGSGSPTVFSTAAAAFEIVAASGVTRTPDFMPFFQ